MPSKAFLSNEHTLITLIFESINFREFLTFRNEYSRKLTPFSESDAARYSLAFFQTLLCLSKKNL